MGLNKNSEAFCLTNYGRWLVVVGVLVVVLTTWVIVGFNEGQTRANMDKLDQMTMHSEALEPGSGNRSTGAVNKQAGQIEMARLQESYSEIATKVREVTVNISASQSMTAAAGNGLGFVDPFGSGNGQVAGPDGRVPNVISVKATAPPISPDAPMPHPFRGVCSNCHSITVTGDPGNTAKVAAPWEGKTSVGSGMIVDPSGFILTNYHIIKNAGNVMVTTAAGIKYRAEVKYTDINWDLAILKINSKTPFPAAVLGDSDLSQEGDIVIAVGNPFGLNQTVTAGIISDTNRTVNISGKSYPGLIQTDAAINRGSSGGPLVNIHGEVIGINAAIYSLTGDFTGVSFAVPVNRAKEAFMAVPTFNGLAANAFDLNVGDIITVAMVPDQPSGWFGVEVGGIDPVIAEQFGRTNTSGVLVHRVFPGSPSGQSGVRRGDIITSINGRRMSDINKFQKISSALLPGESIQVRLARGAKTYTVTATLGDRQQATLVPQGTRGVAVGPAELEWMGMELVPITPALQARFGIPGGETGVIVVEAEGLAAASGILAGDVIKGLNRQGVANMADFAAVSGNAVVTDGVLFDISRQGEPLYITM